MGLLSGPMSVARFRVVGNLPDGWRTSYREQLEVLAFNEPPQGMGKEEVEGWVSIHNLLDTSFADYNRWLYDDVAIFALRIDKKRLPARRFRATLDQRCTAWAAERDVARVPSAVRQELKDELEHEWLARTIPSVAVHELAWHVGSGYLLLHSQSEAVAERVRKRFFRTFGLKMVPWSPLDFLADRALVDGLLARAPTPVQLGIHLAEGAAAK